MIILYFTFFLQILFYQDFLSHYVFFLSNPNFSFSILHPFFNYLTLNFFVLFSPLKPRFQSKQKSFSLHFSSLFLPLPFSPHPLYSPPPDHVFSASLSLLYTPPSLLNPPSLLGLTFSTIHPPSLLNPLLFSAHLLFSTPPFSSRPTFSSKPPLFSTVSFLILLLSVLQKILLKISLVFRFLCWEMYIVHLRKVGAR